MFLIFIVSLIFSDCINKDSVFLRVKPKTLTKSLWQVRKYFPLSVVKKNRDWAYVKDFRGDNYWVELEHLSKDYKCLIVKVKSLDIKSGPGDEYSNKYKEPSKEFDCYKLLERRGNWLLVEDSYGDTGWFNEAGVWIY